ncbi:MAG: glycosyltransferase [Prevotellaceae bacterium]|nr:glycosyltransferase [Prevotellaceae bacterium]
MNISIITTCYNRVKTIGGAIESVLAQDYPGIEYIIVDGASTDGSVETIRKAIDGHDDKVKFISEPDRGMYEAINKGIRMATGDYIGLVHSDDFLYSPHTVTNIVKQLEATRADFLYGDGLFVHPENTGKVVRKWIGGTYRLWRCVMDGYHCIRLAISVGKR